MPTDLHPKNSVIGNVDFSETKMFATWTWIGVNVWEDLGSGITTKTGKQSLAIIQLFIRFRII